MININNNHLKTYAQLVASCFFMKESKCVDYENYEHYYRHDNHKDGKV